MATQEKLTILLQWFKDNEIKYDPAQVEIQIKDGSFGVYALKDLPAGETVVKIPKEAILSPKSTGIANILEDESIQGGCAVALAVMYEMSQGNDSPWHGYLQSLPDHEDLPILWTEDECELFQGTEIENAIAKDKADLQDDYETIIEPLVAKYTDIFPAEAFTLEQFQRVSTLVASRAFEVDCYHEEAMVPFADIFNHRSGSEHVHFETDYEVCDACGALEYCEHQYLAFLEGEQQQREQGSDDDDDDERMGDEDGGDWSDVDEPMDGSDDDEPDTELQDLAQLEIQGVNFWKNDEDEDERKDTCDMVLDRKAKKNEELLNTYGDHPSVVLINKYGFCYDNNENDYVSVPEDDVVDACLQVTKDALRADPANAKKDDDQIEELAMEITRPRWEFFLINEPVLCPADEEDEDDDEDDEDDHEGHDAHSHDGHDHDHDHAHEHEHDEDGGCCAHDDDDDMGGAFMGKAYFANAEGLYEDTLTCLLHIMFVDQDTFAKFADNVENAVEFFDQLAQGKRMLDDWKMKKHVYQVCKSLSEGRRNAYQDAKGNYTTVQADFEKRKKTTNQREYYALTCRMNEKKIIERSIAYYDDMIQQCKPAPKKTNGSAKRKAATAKKIRKH